MSSEASQTFTVSETTSDSFTWTLSETLSASMSFSVKIPFAGSVETEIAIDVSSTQAQTKTTQRSWQYSAQIPVPPETTVETQFSIFEGKADTPFVAKFQVRGTYFLEWKHLGTYASGDIDGWIKGNYPPSMFEVTATGVFKGLKGTRYIVTARPIARAGAEEAGLIAEQTIDFGTVINGELVSNFKPLEQLAQ